MSRLRIEHTTGYRYAEPAAASYNEARMLPVSGDGQFVLHSQLDIAPHTTVNQYDDYWGTRVTSFDVLTPHTELELRATSLVEVRPRALRHRDLTWEGLERLAAGSTRIIEAIPQTPSTQPAEDLVEQAKEIAGRAAGPDAAAMEIARLVGEEISYASGSTHVLTTAAESWEARSGVCQDIAHVTLGALRSVGIPARYASGYLHPNPKAEIGEEVRGESHAWVEWFSGDWNAWDPTNLIDIGERHVVVGVGRDYTDVPPLRGILAGGGESELFVDVTIVRET